MTSKGIKPDDVNTTHMGGRDVRKGTVAAILANAEVLQSENAGDDGKNEALKTIEELAPAAIATGLHHHVSWKNQKIQAIFDSLIKS